MPAITSPWDKLLRIKFLPSKDYSYKIIPTITTPTAAKLNNNLPSLFFIQPPINLNTLPSF